MHIKVGKSERLFLFFSHVHNECTYIPTQNSAYQWWRVESKSWLELEFDERIKNIMILDLFNFTKWYATYGGEFCLSLHFKNLIGYEALRRNYREGGRISQRGNSYLAFYSQFMGDFSFEFTKKKLKENSTHFAILIWWLFWSPKYVTKLYNVTKCKL